VAIKGWSRGAFAVTLAGVVFAGAVACQGSDAAPTEGDATTVQPYAGFQDREIRALEPVLVADLLAGRGAGYALAAELNHYPGPTHVLEFAAELELSADQEKSVSTVKAAMQQEAALLGTQLVDLEEELDIGFRSKAITAEELSSLTGRIAEVEGRLRNVHLQAHLAVVAVLSEDQVARYDELRGYGPADGAGSSPGADASHDHEH
jgi:hypothetical protein